MSDVVVSSLRGFDLRTNFHPDSYALSKQVPYRWDEVRETAFSNGNGPVWKTGSGSKTVFFGFKLRTDRLWYFVTHCGRCEVDGCEHVVALGRAILDASRHTLDEWQSRVDLMRPQVRDWRGNLFAVPKPPTPEEVFQGWLERRQDIAARTAAPAMRDAETSTSELIFLLKRGNQNGRLALEAGTSRKLKGKETMAKPSLFSNQISDRPFNTYMGHPLYQRYAKWCATNFSGMDTHTRWSFQIVDQSGVEMIQATAAEGLLYVHDVYQDRPVGPVQWGEPRVLEWDWTERSPDLFDFKHRVANGGDAFFGQVPLYVDSKGLMVGPLDLGGMEPGDAELAGSAPAVPKAWLAQNAQSKLALKFLPRPPANVVQRSSRVISGVAPTPVVTVEVKDRKDIYGLDFAFRYGDVLEFFLPTQDRIQFVRKSDETVEVVRDLAAEMSATALMRRLGLVRTPAGDWRFEGDKARQVEGFRSLLATDFAEMRAAGFEIAQVSGWSSRVQQAESVTGGFGGEGDGAVFEATDNSAGLEFSMGFVLNGERFNLLPLVSQIVESVGGIEGINRMMAALTAGEPADETDRTLWVVDEQGNWIGLPKRELTPWLSLMVELLSGRRIKDMSAPSLMLSRIEALRMEAQSPELNLGGLGAQIISELLAAKQCVDEVSIEGFDAVLEPFQRTGVHWMRVLAKYGLGGLLGDDRGLGKTVQCIAHLQDMKAGGGLKHPALIVAIPTQVKHWEKHMHRMAPGLRVLVLEGTGRFALMDQLGEYDAVVTTWSKVTLDIELLRKQRFEVGIYDETEKVHNAGTGTAKALRLLNVGYGVALNGSPLENNFGDVWSVIDAVLPGFLGTEALFKKTFRSPIEDAQDINKLRLLRKRLAPFMLRRRKKDSGVTLPPVQNKDVALRITGKQANLYEAIRITTETKVREALDGGGSYESNRGRILAILTRLRQVCVHPLLTDVGASRNIEQSAKLDWIRENVGTMVTEGRRVLVVGFFTQFFDILGPVLDRMGIPYSMIRSDVGNRDAQKEAFKSGKTRVFLLGLKSGGRGTDLPEADTVIHVDPWYNPKAHDQATDRAHRMGQVNTVLNIRLFIEGSFEERVIEIQERKRLFADSLDDETVLDEAKITKDDILEMLKPLQELSAEEQEAA